MNPLIPASTNRVVAAPTGSKAIPQLPIAGGAVERVRALREKRVSARADAVPAASSAAAAPSATAPAPATARSGADGSGVFTLSATLPEPTALPLLAEMTPMDIVRELVAVAHQVRAREALEDGVGRCARRRAVGRSS